MAFSNSFLAKSSPMVEILVTGHGKKNSTDLTIKQAKMLRINKRFSET
jgi:hypothetical protein